MRMSRMVCVVAAISVTANIANAAVTANDVNRANLKCVSTKQRYEQAYAEELAAARMVFSYREQEKAAFAAGVPLMFAGNLAAAEVYFRAGRRYGALAEEWRDKQVIARSIAIERFYDWIYALQDYLLIVQAFRNQ